MTSSNAARKYFRRLAANARTRAALARSDASRQTDPAARRRLEALAEGHEEQARIYDGRHDEVE